jgi:menaquinone reductase, molybdopterin-binding-like subunit
VNELPASSDERTGQITRRTFLRVVSATTVGAVAFTGCKPVEHEMVAQSRALLAEEILSAYDDWYATACTGCTAGCGVIVRVVEGRAKKAEGTPGHPVNQGKLCARGQALVQEQYHPDRVQGPLLRSGPRGGGSFLPISWRDALDRLAAGLGERAGAGEIVVVTPPHAGLRGLLAQRLAAGLGARVLTLEPISTAPLRTAVGRVFGTPASLRYRQRPERALVRS